MKKYDPSEIEKKWQEKWEKDGLYKTAEDKNKPKYYILDMFPYPSGVGLHVGHPKGYIATDIFARTKTMQGYNVLHPMGWDAFGLPAENFALKNKVHPKISTNENVKTYKRQLKMFGFSYDWDREVNTTDPEFYKWTQWAFLQMFKRGLAYESHEPIIWCPSCKTGLAAEDLEGGVCERCGSEVERKPMRQWVLRITDYAERMLQDLEKLPDWEESIKEQQKNWIGKSEGAEVDFEISDKKVTVFTTRPDTLFGATYFVLAPEHSLLEEMKDNITNYEEVERYIKKAQKKSDLERTDLAKEKTGVEVKGIKAVNPVNGKEIPVWVADYVLIGYGTGAIMAVPAHDERDFEFAKKFGIKIKQVVSYNIKDYDKTLQALGLLNKINKGAKEKNVKVWLLGGLACAFYTRVVYREHEDLDLIVKGKNDLKIIEEILKELEFKKVAKEKTDNLVSTLTYKNSEGMEVDVNHWIEDSREEWAVSESDFEDEEKELSNCKSLVLSHEYIKKFKQYQRKSRDKEKDKLDLEFLNGKVIVENGTAVNSEKFDGLTTAEFKKEITDWLEKKELGKKAINYKLNDWVFSRQRYWGEPIPIIHCEKCGAVAVPEEELPVTLPEVENYEPTGTGESPLAGIDDWVNVKCPKCGGKAKRETNTMPQWAGSSWYYLRYIDPDNDKALVDKEKEKYWSPIDFYVGGAEHATRHLIYARFWHKFLYDIGVVNYDEPFTRLQHVGLIMAEDGRKMSKRWGNVVNPDDMILSFGADAMRVYEMFMGPFSQSCAWNTNGLVGTRKFLEKVWRSAEKVGSDLGLDKDLNRLLHKTIKKVGDDIADFKFNTAISQMMILVNEFETRDKLPKDTFKKFLKLLAPFAPHIAEELWSEMGEKNSVFRSGWPKYDEKELTDEMMTIAIQINGKVRDSILVAADIGEDEIKKLALASEKVNRWIDKKQVKKVIYIKGKLLSIVV